MPDPAILMSEISQDCAALDEASKELKSFVDRLALAELDYEDAMDRALVAVEEEYRKRDEKLPSERQREAHARQKIDPGLRRNFLDLKRRVELIEKWGRIKEKTLSGRQSELSFLKAEGSAIGTQQPSWSKSVTEPQGSGRREGREASNPSRALLPST